MRVSRTLNNESGFVLIVTTLVLVAVTAVGLTMTKLSMNESYMATNERCKEQARYNSENLSMATAKLIRHVTDLDSQGIVGIPEQSILAQGINYPAATGSVSPEREFYDKLVDPNSGGGGCNDLDLGPANIPGLIDLRPLGVESVAGGRALEFATGYTQGVGVGSTSGGAALWYLVAARGDGCDNARQVSYMRYRKTIGVAGGL